MKGEASKPRTSAAMVVGNALASNRVIGPTPDFPALAPAQVDSRVNPSGLIIPRPEMTTLRLCIAVHLKSVTAWLSSTGNLLHYAVSAKYPF